MKTSLRILAVAAFALFNSNLYSQNILAGQHGAYDYYQDITDTSLYVPGTAVTDTTLFDVDVNGDLINDFRFGSTFIDQGNSSREEKLWVQPLGQNQACYTGFDSCFGNDVSSLFAYRELMANPFTSMTNIDRYYSWKDTAMTFSRRGFDCCYPTNFGYSCSISSFGASPTYLGVRVILSADTVYGWVKLRMLTGGTNSDTLVIDAYACQTSLTGISNNPANSAKIFPQPANDLLHVQPAQPATGETFVIYDAFGQIIREEKISDGVSAFEISTAGLPSGVYQYALRSGGTAARGKFIVSH